MGKYFDQFPKIVYDINGARLSNYVTVTNIFFRLQILRSVLNNVSSYYEYLIRDGDTPEILADNIYDDSQAHWIILLANDIVDPHYDWPLDTNSFNNFIINKYGSIAAAKTGIHHYEKVIQRTESASGLMTETRFVINQEQLSDVGNLPDVPYDSYETLSETQTVETFNMGNGKAVEQITFRDDITFWDYEEALNEKKRAIKIIKPEYYPQIINEFAKLTKNTNAPYLRKLV